MVLAPFNIRPYTLIKGCALLQYLPVVHVLLGYCFGGASSLLFLFRFVMKAALLELLGVVYKS